MAAQTLSRAKYGCNTRSFAAPSLPKRASVRNASPLVTRAAAAVGEVPDMNKRNIMNLLLLGAASLPVGAMAVPYLAFFVPKSAATGAGGQPAKDAAGNDVTVSGWLKTHPAGDRNLVQGLKGDPSYLVVNQQGELEKYSINAVCTHLGCVVPWNNAENKFKCPCHGSQYDPTGKVVRGPAPLSLALAHVSIQEDNVLLVPWTETDFRTGLEPWWR